MSAPHRRLVVRGPPPIGDDDRHIALCHACELPGDTYDRDRPPGHRYRCADCQEVCQMCDEESP